MTTSVAVTPLMRTSRFEPYKLQAAGAIAALLFTALATLSIGKGLNILIDQGFAGDDPAALRSALLVLLGIGVAIAAGSYMRYFLMTWLGERVVAQHHQIRLEPPGRDRSWSVLRDQRSQ